MANLKQIFEEHKGPPVRIEGIIRAFGLELDKKADLDDEISGQIEKIDSDSYKISVNKNDHYYRQRFTMAHEFGHFILHSHLISDGVDDSRAYRSVPEGRFYNRLIGKSEESEANRFAAGILMPASLVREHWQLSNGSAPDLAKKFQVSEQAMKIRLNSLELS